MRPTPLLITMLAAGDPRSPPAAIMAQDSGLGEVQVDRAHDRLMRIVMNRRARLGIKVNLQARGTDSIGAYVDAVTPSGPAAQAGIRSGDLITKLDGTSVLSRGSAQGVADHQNASLPGLRLIELAARLEPNDTVPIEYRRGSDRRTVQVVTEDEPDVAYMGAPPRAMLRFRGPGGTEDDPRMPAGEFFERVDPPGAHWDVLARSPLARLELAPLNSDLGQYFGVNQGVLVISAPPDSALGLKGGDVVLAVDGRRPAGPSHLLRILRSYESGESFKLDILRNHKRETVTARLGEPDS
ncbi:MAG TPA: PDZ domain-containing protein [Gemmatimonadales bacterium]|nr:PDZ domain-containing protein [Gemmatimonadales bacterium]